jgi:tetratricopeptide (TPR) repeat protein
MLADAAPARQYQILNCGVIAISSLDVLLLHKQIVKRRPDLIVIYTGHNEAYGADGVDTPVQRTFATRRAAQTWLWFRNLRLVRLARTVFGQMKKTPPAGAPEGFGMWLMRDRTVPAHDPKHDRLLQFYRENILEMLAQARDRGVDVVLCTQISNERDQSPLGSTHGPAFDAAREDEWRTAFAHGVASMNAQRWSEALTALDACRAIDPDYAEVRFRRGRCLDAQGDSAAAIQEYIAARDCDVVHFRACSAQNEVLRQIAGAWDPQGKHHLVFVDLDRRIHEQYPYGAGRRFFTEHVHPYPTGHAWIAREIARDLAGSAIAARFGTWDLTRIREGESYVQQVGMTGMDELFGDYLTDVYKLAKWPFPECYENDAMRAYLQGRIRDLTARLDPNERQVLAELPRDKAGDLFDFGRRHYGLFNLYRSQRRGDEALHELELVSEYWWPAAFLETDHAQILVGMHRLDEAEMHLRRARELDPSYPPIHFVAGALYHARGSLIQAREEFQAYLKVAPDGPFASAARVGLQAVGGAPGRTR